MNSLFADLPVQSAPADDAIERIRVRHWLRQIDDADAMHDLRVNGLDDAQAKAVFKSWPIGLDRDQLRTLIRKAQQMGLA